MSQYNPRSLALALALVAFPTIAGAEEGPRIDPVVDGLVTGGLSALWIGSELGKQALAPTACRWCETTTFDRRARDALVWQDTGPPHVASNILLYGVVPLGLAALSLASHSGKSDRWEQTGVDLLIMAESAAITASINQLVKFAVGRERPFVSQLRAGDKSTVENAKDNNLSFFSGHTSVTFALAVSAGTLSSMRRSPLAPVVWSTGMVLASATGYLRMAADKHWMSDVLVGAVVGSAIGFAVPYLLHRPRQTTDSTQAAALTLTPMGNGLSFGGSF